MLDLISQHVLAEDGTIYTIIAMSIIATGTTMYAQSEQKKAQAAAEKKASKAAEAQRKLLELQAGEYDEINKKQMAIQAYQGVTQNLSKLLAEQQEPTVFTLPPTTENPAPLERINKAIDDWIKGN